jgi:hypothetical protein
MSQNRFHRKGAKEAKESDSRNQDSLFTYCTGSSVKQVQGYFMNSLSQKYGFKEFGKVQEGFFSVC